MEIRQAKLKCRIRLANQVGSSTPPSTIFQHSLLDLWAQPSPFQTQEEFMEAARQHFELAGEMIWAVVSNEFTRHPHMFVQSCSCWRPPFFSRGPCGQPV